MDVTIHTRKHGATDIVETQGEVDLYSSPKLRKSLFLALEQRPTTLIVELTKVTYMDSSGIATLVEGLQLARKYETRLQLVGLSQAVMEVFQLARLDSMFEMYATEEEALRVTST